MTSPDPRGGCRPGSGQPEGTRKSQILVVKAKKAVAGRKRKQRTRDSAAEIVSDVSALFTFNESIMYLCIQIGIKRGSNITYDYIRACLGLMAGMVASGKEESMESAIENFGELGVISKQQLTDAYHNYQSNGSILVHERKRESKITDIPEALYEPLINKMNEWYSDTSTAVTVEAVRTYLASLNPPVVVSDQTVQNLFKDVFGVHYKNHGKKSITRVDFAKHEARMKEMIIKWHYSKLLENAGKAIIIVEDESYANTNDHRSESWQGEIEVKLKDGTVLKQA